MDFKQKVSLVAAIAALISSVGCGVVTAQTPFKAENLIVTGILAVAAVIAFVCFFTLKQNSEKK